MKKLTGILVLLCLAARPEFRSNTGDSKWLQVEDRA